MLKNRTMIKICGMTRRKDVVYAVNQGVDALGFILAKSPRQVVLDEVKKLSHNLPPFVARVAVVINPEPEEVVRIEKSGLFDYIQFHGSEDPQLLENCILKSIKAISIAAKEDLAEVEKYRESADYLLFDTKIGSQSGGTGESFDWSLITELKLPFILAGGLGPDNIEEALKKLNPLAVDLNSCLENKPGQKNHRLIKDTLAKIDNFKAQSETKMKLKFI